MAKHAAIQQAMERIPQLLKDFRQQVLTQAVTGKLTEEWRVGKELEEWEETKERKKHREWDLNLPLKWKLLPFYSVANIDANLVDPNKYLDFVLVAPNNIEKATGQLLEKVLTREIKPKSDKHFFKAGSIVYSKIRPYLSKLILADFDGLCSADMYPISAEIDIHYLFQYMKSDEFLNFATTAGERSVLPKINQKGLNQIPVPVPPLEEQQEIFRRVESLFEKATAIEQRYEQLKSQIDTLPQAILHKAFKGELVPQLDSDGSAVELLEEIEEMKAKSKPKSKSKNKRSVRAAVENGLGMVAESGEAYNTTRIKK
ncbi:type I restriction-modification system [Nonlabens tegetincola]|uniref:Type I restriction-modification system n=1 Tax=Nonlabens tegetincola TaxID=323273 RepID=A0A090PXG0_9FLAO|nr:restriction endonuclease subunit S [Nonlabens tegetincola]GAK95514.1 type I restriction-modification system [Nonlabens tegetincola]